MKPCNLSIGKYQLQNSNHGANMATAHEGKEVQPVIDFKQICIHFADQILWRASDQPQERLTEPDKLLRFAGRVGILEEGELNYLRERMAENPIEAQAALERAKAVREATYHILFAVANHMPQDPAHVALLNEAVAEAQDQMHLVPGKPGDSFEWRWKSDKPQFDVVLWTAARSVADLLTSEELKKVKSCPGEGCAYLFMDLSRNGKRRWCEMDVCGNRNKVTRFRQSHHR
ncbi:MAG: hypothetical protein QOH93_2240 [Chloroflexia bacterium]|jgi:predicted RNA-binding Zn ribbon-like protein|nr:hypothetical protein [Chloroflexia bacterium]